MNAQVERSWQLGLLAKDLARVRLSRNDESAERARRDLVKRMGALHGLPQKIGQILSLSEISNSSKTYTPLTEGEPAVTAEEALAEISRELGQPLDQCFSHIGGDGISASLGQVHRATLHNGTEVAVKFQYPGIADAVAQDLKALGWLTVPLGGLRRGFDVSDYQGEVGRMLDEELDYGNEARIIQHFGRFVSDWNDVTVPAVVPEFTRGRVLTMTWLEGETIESARRWPAGDRLLLAETLLRLFLTSSLRWGYLHSDPHPGNYRFLYKEGRPVVGLLDFGCVKKLDRETTTRLGDLLRDAVAGKLDDDPERALSRFVALGFKQEALEPMMDRLPGLCRILFEPFRSDTAYPVSDWRMAERTEELLGDFRWNFRFAGPASLIYFMRAYQGVIQYLEALDAPIRWRDILEQSVSNTAPSEAPAPVQRDQRKTKAKKLHIQVLENKKLKARITFRAHLAEDLAELIPPEVTEKLERRQLNIETIAKRAVESGFAPMELFLLEEENKEFRVWLE